MNTLESRLTEALNARAEQVQPADLGPGHLPATVSPLRRRLQVGAAIGAAAAAAAAAVVAVSVLGDDGDAGPAPAPQPTVSDTSNPTTEPTTDPTPDPAPTTDVDPPASSDLTDLLPADPTDYVEPGRTIPLRDGASAVVERGRLLITGAGDGTLSGELDGFDLTDSLDVTQVSFDEVGDGYLVEQTGGGDSQLQKLYVVTDGGGLTEVVEPGDVPFGFGYADGFPDGYLTWTVGDGSGLYTRVQVGDLAEQRFEVYQWDVAGPGPDAEPESPERTLVPTLIGTACFDVQTDTVTPC